MNLKEAKKFCDAWLPAWTGNNPENLMQFYADDAFYSDPTVKEGLKGKNEILPYLKKLLDNNPDWKWTTEEIFITEKGFTLKWKAQIPVKETMVIEYGLDIVEMNNGIITRNEVYFDTLTLIKTIKER